jgi:hypothetical protein
MLTEGYKKHFYNRTKAFLTAGGKVNLSAGTAGFTGVLPITQGGTGTDVGFLDHSHDGDRRQGQKLLQANTHESVDTDTATTALHHTLGTGNFQAAPGNHALTGSNHTASGLTTGNVLTATSPTTFAFQAAPAGSAWQILTAGTILAPTIVFAGGQVVMIEIYR